MTSLVPYGDSDEEEEVEAIKGAKRKKKKLDTFECLDESSQSKRDNVHTSLGIAASRPLKGDWLCYAFISINYEAEVYNVMQQAYNLISSRNQGQVERIQDIHLSLTKPILVRFHEKDELVAKCREAVMQFSQTRSKFPMAFSTFTVLPSQDKGRLFWAAEVGLGWQELCSLTTLLNHNIASFHARAYFEEARFHASFAHMSSAFFTMQQQLDMASQLEIELGKKLRSCSSLYIDKIGIAIGSQTYYMDISA